MKRLNRNGGGKVFELWSAGKIDEFMNQCLVAPGSTFHLGIIFNMKLFDEFKNYMLTNDEICHQVADSLLSNITPEILKKDFSNYLNRMQDEIYNTYLDVQKVIRSKGY